MMATAMSQMGSLSAVNGSAKMNTDKPDSLYACTSCFSRYSLEALSPDSMLCKKCRGSDASATTGASVMKCKFCRTEFPSNSSSNACRKCEANLKQFGKPKPCSYCSLQSAFIGTKCQRCDHSEKKYGPPVNCVQCRQKCAFDRKDAESLRKVEGMILCWLCTMSYKRAMAKASKGKEPAKGHTEKLNPHSRHSSLKDHKRPSSHSARPSSGPNGKHSNGMGKPNGGSSNSNGFGSNWDSLMGAPSTKKPRLDHSGKPLSKTSNGSMPSGNSSNLPGIDSSASDLGAITLTSISVSNDSASDSVGLSDNVVAVTQLREKIILLDRQLKGKAAEMLKKEKTITELKAEINKEQRSCREKIGSLQKNHQERIHELNQKIATLSRQLASSGRSTGNSSKKGNKEVDNSPLGF